MKYIIILLCLCSCTPNYHLRRMNYHLKKAIEKGASLDTLKRKVYDSASIGPIQDSIIHDRIVDTTIVRIICDSLVNKSKEPEQRRKNTKKLQDVICPEVNIDSTYYIPVDIQGKTYQLKARVKIVAKGGSHKAFFNVDSLKVPYIKEEYDVHATARPSWLYMVLAAVLGSIVTLIIVLKSRK